MRGIVFVPLWAALSFTMGGCGLTQSLDGYSAGSGEDASDTGAGGSDGGVSDGNSGGDVAVGTGGSGGASGGAGGIAGTGGDEVGGAAGTGGDEPGGSGGMTSGGFGGTGGKPQGCAPNSTESTSCGACNSGIITRKCNSLGTWDAWGACADEKSGYPYKPNKHFPYEKELVCPDDHNKYNYPEVFFVAHPGDESIAMGGAIRRYVDDGRLVFVELLTQGGAALAWTGEVLGDGESCAWHGGTHDYKLTADEFKKAFVAEFTEAVASLGVTGIYVSDFPDGSLQKSDVKTRLNWWRENAPSGLGLTGIAGRNDPRPDGKLNYDNVAVWDVFVSSGVKNIRGYFIYHFITQQGTGSIDNYYIESYLDAKRTALRAYQTWHPSNAWYGIGYHSQFVLINEVWETDHEYLIVLD